MPEVFNVALLERATEDGVVYGSKAVGEPPLMLAFSVREALRQAAAAFGPSGTSASTSRHRRRPRRSSGRFEQARGGGQPPHTAAVVEGGVGLVPDQPDAGARPLEPRSEQVATGSGG